MRPKKHEREEQSHDDKMASPLKITNWRRSWRMDFRKHASRHLRDCRPAGDDAGTGVLTTPESHALLRRRGFYAPFASASSELGQILGAQKNPEHLLGAFWGWRSEADGFSAFAVLTTLSLPCA